MGLLNPFLHCWPSLEVKVDFKGFPFLSRFVVRLLFLICGVIVENQWDGLISPFHLIKQWYDASHHSSDVNSKCCCHFWRLLSYSLFALTVQWPEKLLKWNEGENCKHDHVQKGGFHWNVFLYSKFWFCFIHVIIWLQVSHFNHSCYAYVFLFILEIFLYWPYF